MSHIGNPGIGLAVIGTNFIVGIPIQPHPPVITGLGGGGGPLVEEDEFVEPLRHFVTDEEKQRDTEVAVALLLMLDDS